MFCKRQRFRERAKKEKEKENEKTTRAPKCPPPLTHGVRLRLDLGEELAEQALVLLAEVDALWLGVFFFRGFEVQGGEKEKKKVTSPFENDDAERNKTGAQNRHFSTEREPFSGSALARLGRHERYLEPGAEEQAAQGTA